MTQRKFFVDKQTNKKTFPTVTQLSSFHCSRKSAATLRENLVNKFYEPFVSAFYSFLIFF